MWAGPPPSASAKSSVIRRTRYLAAARRAPAPDASDSDGAANKGDAAAVGDATGDGGPAGPGGGESLGRFVALVAPSSWAFWIAFRNKPV